MLITSRGIPIYDTSRLVAKVKSKENSTHWRLNESLLTYLPTGYHGHSNRFKLQLLKDDYFITTYKNFSCGDERKKNIPDFWYLSLFHKITSNKILRSNSLNQLLESWQDRVRSEQVVSNLLEYWANHYEVFSDLNISNERVRDIFDKPRSLKPKLVVCYYNEYLAVTKAIELDAIPIILFSRYKRVNHHAKY